MTDQTISPQEQAQKLWNEIEAEESGRKPETEDPKPTDSPAQTDVEPKGEAAKAATPRTEERTQDDQDDDPVALKRKIGGYEVLINQQADLLAQMGNRLRNVEGSLGGMKSLLKKQTDAAKAVTNAGGDAPSEAEISAAQRDPEALAELQREYPEFAKVLAPVIKSTMAELESLKKRLDAKPDQSPAPELEAGVDANPEARAEDKDDRYERLQQDFKKLQIEIAHKGWEESVKTPEFLGWLQSAPREVRLLAASEETEDAIRLLDLWKEAAKPAPDTTQQRQRLDAAARIPMTGNRSRVRTVNVDEMTPQEFWAYLDEKDKQTEKGT